MYDFVHQKIFLILCDKIEWSQISPYEEVSKAEMSSLASSDDFVSDQRSDILSNNISPVKRSRTECTDGSTNTFDDVNCDELQSVEVSNMNDVNSGETEGSARDKKRRGEDEPVSRFLHSSSRLHNSIIDNEKR
jgi:hypothetical protein